MEAERLVVVEFAQEQQSVANQPDVLQINHGGAPGEQIVQDDSGSVASSRDSTARGSKGKKKQKPKYVNLIEL